MFLASVLLVTLTARSASAWCLFRCEPDVSVTMTLTDREKYSCGETFRPSFQFDGRNGPRDDDVVPSVIGVFDMDGSVTPENVAPLVNNRFVLPQAPKFVTADGAVQNVQLVVVNPDDTTERLSEPLVVPYACTQAQADSASSNNELDQNPRLNVYLGRECDALDAALRAADQPNQRGLFAALAKRYTPADHNCRRNTAFADQSCTCQHFILQSLHEMTAQEYACRGFNVDLSRANTLFNEALAASIESKCAAWGCSGPDWSAGFVASRATCNMEYADDSNGAHYTQYMDMSPGAVSRIFKGPLAGQEQYVGQYGCCEPACQVIAPKIYSQPVVGKRGVRPASAGFAYTGADGEMCFPITDGNLAISPNSPHNEAWNVDGGLVTKTYALPLDKPDATRGFYVAGNAITHCCVAPLCGSARSGPGASNGACSLVEPGERSCANGNGRAARDTFGQCPTMKDEKMGGLEAVCCQRDLNRFPGITRGTLNPQLRIASDERDAFRAGEEGSLPSAAATFAPAALVATALFVVALF